MQKRSDSHLTQREKEVVRQLLRGGRVATIAELFGVSPRTVSNHLKSSFLKLDVHSQAELIELAHSEPERLGIEEEAGPLAQTELAELQKRCERARDRLIARVEAAYVDPPTLSQLRAAVRAALPLDAERRRDWRDWLEFRARMDTQEGLVGDPQRGIEEWKASNVDRVSRLQDAGMVREELDPAEFFEAIGALALGAGARLLGAPSEASAERELRMLDAFIDSIGISESEPTT